MVKLQPILLKRLNWKVMVKVGIQLQLLILTMLHCWQAKHVYSLA